jgi:hypothetical protein
MTYALASFSPRAALVPRRGYVPPVRGPGFLGRLPEARVTRSFEGARTTLEAMARAILGPRGEPSAKVRAFAEWVTRDVWPKDYLGEILAVRNCLVQPSPWRPGTPMIKYSNDPRHVEWVKDAQTMVEEIEQHGSTVVDCDELGILSATMLLQLGRPAKLVAVGYGPALTHVGVVTVEPKTGRRIWLDSVAGPRERESAATAKQVLEWDLD